MSDQLYKIHDAINELEMTIKSFHCMVSLVAYADRQPIDAENLYHLLNRTGDHLQNNLTNLQSVAKAIPV
jgi:hypothetical protein